MPEMHRLTERQQAWFASVGTGLERDTGCTLEQWVELASTCPETSRRRRLAWMRTQHGIGQNRASLILNAAFPADAMWSDPEALADTLWSEPAPRAILERVQAAATALPGVVIGQRRGFTAFSRTVQFAALRPAKGGARLGLALDPSDDPVLRPAGRDSWSERLRSVLALTGTHELDDTVVRLLHAAWSRS